MTNPVPHTIDLQTVGSSNQMTDMLMNYITMNAFNKLGDLNLSELNFKTILKFLVMICLSEIKSLVKLLAGKGNSGLKLLFVWLYSQLSKISFQKKIIECPVTIETEMKKVNFTLSHEMILLIIKYINNNKSCYYDNNQDIDATYSSAGVVFEKLYKNIIIDLNDCRFVFLTNICTSGLLQKGYVKPMIKLDNREIELVNMTRASKGYAIIKDTCSLYYLAMLYDLKLDCVTLNDHLLNCSYSTVCASDGKQNITPLRYLINVCSVIEQHHGFKKAILWNCIMVYLVAISGDDVNVLNDTLISIAQKYVKTRILETPFYNVDTRGIHRLNSVEMYTNGCSTVRSYSYNIPKSIIDAIIDDWKTRNATAEKTNVISITISNNSDQTDEQQYNNLMTTIAKEGKQHNKVKVYSIKIEQKRDIEKIDNPEYARYLENKELFEKILEKGNKVNFNLSSIPEKQIDKVTVTPTIVSTFIKEREKSFETLYLRQQDERTLFDLVKNYNNKEVFEDLGLTRKLGILLHGVPGTGKSTTIEVIGSTLKKDIYDVNLRNVTKCSELRLIFEHVSKNCNNGGIIVFEDIDCQTDIVKKRTGVCQQSLHEIIENEEDELTLAYFLSLLDGTLCSEDTIFIITTNHIEHIDEAIYRKGRIDMCIELKPCDHHQVRTIYKKVFRENIDEEVLKTIEEFKYPPSHVLFKLREYMYSKQECVIMMKDMMDSYEEYLSHSQKA